MKLIEKIKYFDENEIRFLNKNLIHYGKRFNKTEYISLFGRTFEEKFYDSLLKQIDNNHDYIFVIRTAGIGEAYLLNFMIDEIIKNNNVKSPCIVTHRLVYKELFKVYQNKIPCYVLDEIGLEDFNKSINTRFFKYKGKTFQVIHSTIKESQQIFQKYIYNKGDTYPDIIRKYAHVQKFSYFAPKFDDSDKDVLNLVNDLKLDKFVFFISESNGTKKYTQEFWPFCAEKLRENGYDIFVNTKDGVCSWAKSANITISQAFYLATLSKGIIAMRSGMLELLSTIDVPKHVIYTEHAHYPVSAQNMINKTSIAYYPNVNTENLFEYDTETLSMQYIINNICVNIK